jgi:hypothetical protein
MTPSPAPLSRRLRRWVCGLVAAAMTLAPVLSTAAEAHEATHAVSGEAHFHADAHEHGAAPDGMSDASDLLHGLAHAVHACAHAVALPAANVLAVFGDAAADLVMAVRTAPPDAPRTHPFRPPIA